MMQQRCRSIDILRTASIFEMVVVHFRDYLSDTKNYYGLFGAPMFLFLSGMSQHIWFASQKRQNKDPLEIKRIAVRRGLSLSAIGLAIAMAVFGLEQLWTCDVLVVAGMAQIILAHVNLWGVNSMVILGSCGAVMLGTPFIQSIMEADEYWNWEEYAMDENMSINTITTMDVLKIHLFAGYFPLFPFVVYPLLGLVIGRAIVSNQNTMTSSKEQHTISKIFMVGATMVTTAISLLLVGNAFPELQSHVYLRGGYRMYLPTFPYIIGSVGRIIMLFIAAFRLIDCRPAPRDNIHSKIKSNLNMKQKDSKLSLPWRGFDLISNRYGRASLTIYFLHQAVIFWPMRIAGWLQNIDWEKKYLFEMCESWQAVIIGTIFVVLMYPLIGWMDRMSIPRLEHVMRWLCS